MEHALLIDGTNIVYRTFYALQNTNLQHEGIPTWAVFGLLNTLRKAVAETHPTTIRIAFDPPGGCPTRKLLYPGYKAGRVNTAPELSDQLELAALACGAAGLGAVTAFDWEADDVLASAVAQAPGLATVMTSDRDAYQMLSPTTQVLTPDWRTITVDTLQEQYELTPAQYASLAALRGEPSDNLPGIRGIGEKLGVRLLHTFGSIDGIFEADDDELQAVVGPATARKLREGEHVARLCALVGTLRTDIPLPPAAHVKDISATVVVDVFERIGLRRPAEALLEAFAQPAQVN